MITASIYQKRGNYRLLRFDAGSVESVADGDTFGSVSTVDVTFRSGEKFTIVNRYGVVDEILAVKRAAINLDLAAAQS